MKTAPIASALETIYQKRGVLRPADVVEESRPTTAPLHNCFEWNDTEAAEKWRLEQAAHLIRSVSVVIKKPDGSQGLTRKYVALHNISGKEEEHKYEQVKVVLEDDKLRAEYVAYMRRDAETFRRRYEHLAEYAAIVREVLMPAEELIAS